jgi:hypothetical protein
MAFGRAVASRAGALMCDAASPASSIASSVMRSTASSSMSRSASQMRRSVSSVRAPDGVWPSASAFSSSSTWCRRSEALTRMRRSTRWSCRRCSRSSDAMRAAADGESSSRASSARVMPSWAAIASGGSQRRWRSTIRSNSGWVAGVVEAFSCMAEASATGPPSAPGRAMRRAAVGSRGRLREKKVGARAGMFVRRVRRSAPDLARHQLLKLLQYRPTCTSASVGRPGLADRVMTTSTW